MDTVTDLVRWDVPFAEARDPSVTLIAEQSRESADVAVLVVAPHGLDKYPKYLVRFDKVLVMFCYEEALDLGRGYRKLTGVHESVCAYVWPDSPWLNASRGWVEFCQWPDVRHYLVFGGDSIVELIATGPRVERLDECTVIERSYEV